MVALHVLHAAGGRFEPDVPRVPGNPGFRKRDQLRAFLGRLLDQRDSFVDGRVEIEENRSCLDGCGSELWMLRGHENSGRWVFRRR
ncbi:hypothetical protein D3C83_104230 [compost metagenome]